MSNEDTMKFNRLRTLLSKVDVATSVTPAGIAMTVITGPDMTDIMEIGIILGRMAK